MFFINVNLPECTVSNMKPDGGSIVKTIYQSKGQPTKITAFVCKPKIMGFGSRGSEKRHKY